MESDSFRNRVSISSVEVHVSKRRGGLALIDREIRLVMHAFEIWGTNHVVAI